MAKYRNPYDEPREVPLLGRVVDVDEVVPVPDALAPSFLEAGWIEDEPPATVGDAPPTPNTD